MSIEEIKNALYELRKLCAQQDFCASCPFSVDGNCSTLDTNGKRAYYPEQWALNDGGMKR